MMYLRGWSSERCHVNGSPQVAAFAARNRITPLSLSNGYGYKDRFISERREIFVSWDNKRLHDRVRTAHICFHKNFTMLRCRVEFEAKMKSSEILTRSLRLILI